MRKLQMSLPSKNIILSVLFGAMLLSMFSADASSPKKRGRSFHKRHAYGNAEDMFRFGLIGGVNRTNIEGASTFDNTYLYSYHAGLLADIGVAPIFLIEPQLLYNNKGVQSSSTSAKLTMSYAELRLNGKYLLSGSLSLLAGPYFGMLTSAKASFEGQSVDVKDNFSPFDFGLNGALEYQFHFGLGAGLQYSIGLANINTNAPSGYSQPSRTHNVLQLSLFYLFSPRS